MEKPQKSNIAETLARELRKPLEICSEIPAYVRRIALPPKWTLREVDNEPLLPAPRRKQGRVSLIEPESFIAYVARHGVEDQTTIWCAVDYAAGRVGFQAILNDHGGKPDDPHWRDHVAVFNPKFSDEWKRWNRHNGSENKFTQFEFASFIEENLKDIRSVDESPSGAQMLTMALNMEANQDVKFKSAIRLQSGGVSLQYEAQEDENTAKSMQLFERFTIGIPVFWAGEAYQLGARLRYRVRDSKLTFWYELVRQDLVLEDATKTLIAKIQDGVGELPFFFGASS